ILLGIGLVIATMIIRWRNDRKNSSNLEGEIEKDTAVRARREKASAKEVGKAFIDALWGLLVPIIILGGIYGGIFTPTEAAVVSVFYGLFVGVFIYRTLNIKKLYSIFIAASVQTAIIMFVVST